MTIYYRLHVTPAPRRPAPYGFRDALCEAQNWRCCYCSVQMQPLTRGEENPDDATLEHIIPHFYGGALDFDNCVAACRSCNEARRCMKAFAFLNIRRKLKKRAQWPAGTVPSSAVMAILGEQVQNRRQTKMMAARTGLPRSEVGRRLGEARVRARQELAIAA